MGGKARSRWIIGICIAVALGTLVLCVRQMRRHSLDGYMASYRQLVKDRATEQEAIARLHGAPHEEEIIRDDRGLADSYSRWIPIGPAPRHVGGKVFTYAADPSGEGDGGYLVYVFFNKRGIATDSVMGRSSGMVGW